MTTQGIDVSMYQGNIDFKRVKASGYTFVIIRMNNWDNVKRCNVVDPYFNVNYNNAKAAGLNVGAYFFTNANTLEYVDVELSLCKSIIKGKSFEYPIYVDVERRQQFDQGKQFCTNLVEKWCSGLEAFGAFAGVYCSRYWYTNFVDEKTRERYACWIADWASTCTYKGTYGIWQNCSADVSGVSGKVDHDYCYQDYPSIIKKAGRNNWEDKQSEPNWKQMYDTLLGDYKKKEEQLARLKEKLTKTEKEMKEAEDALKDTLKEV